MITKRKFDFFKAQGFSVELIEKLVECGVDKQLLWFLTQYKKYPFELSEFHIRLVNDYLENPKPRPVFEEKKLKKSSLKSKEVEEELDFRKILEIALEIKIDTDRKNANILYRLDNGYYFSKLDPEDLHSESMVMANCVYSHFSHHVIAKEVAIISLKRPNGKTVGHIEIKRNGMIGQNFAKANSELNREYWLMVLDFFKANSKGVDTDSIFGESYVVGCSDLFIREIALSIPTEVHMRIVNGEKQKDQLRGFQVKRFVPSKRVNDSYINMSNKQEVIEFVESKKRQLVQAYDNLITNIIDTGAAHLYLSDQIKERLFGSGKSAYFMRGNSYNLSEMDPNYIANSIVEAIEEEMLNDEAVEGIVNEEGEIIAEPAPDDNVRPEAPAPEFVNMRIRRVEAVRAGLIDAAPNDEDNNLDDLVDIEVPREAILGDHNDVEGAEIVEIIEEDDLGPGDIMPPEPFEHILGRVERRN